MGIFDKFKIGFKKSASALTSGIKEIIIKKEIDDENLNKIEEFLIQSDVGVEAASEIKEIISNKKIDPNKDLTSEINYILKEYIISLMKPLENNSFFERKEKLNSTLVSGVNGVGKTTTIGKIGKILKTNGNKVMFAASDTFRAAAIEQLENWANKINVSITKSSQGADPASVAYKAVEKAINNNFHQVLIDTAGRLQNKKNLMEEYKKIANVIKKIDTQKIFVLFAGDTKNESYTKLVRDKIKQNNLEGVCKILGSVNNQSADITIVNDTYYKVKLRIGDSQNDISIEDGFSLTLNDIEKENEILFKRDHTISGYTLNYVIEGKLNA